MIRVTLGLKPEPKIFTVPDLVFSIGRATDNGVICDAPTVSAHHLTIQWERSGYRVRDMGSSNGSWTINGSFQEAWLTDTMECLLGDVPCLLEVSDPLLCSSSFGQWLMAGSICRFGRAVDNDLIIAHPTVSQYHGRLIRGDGSNLFLENHSQQGITVDGLPVDHSPLPSQCALQIGAVVVSLDNRMMDISSELVITTDTRTSPDSTIKMNISGILGRDQAEQLDSALAQVQISDARCIHIDLANCRQLHPRSLEVLLEHAGRGNSPRISLLNPSIAVRRALALANAEQILPCIRSPN